MDTEKRLNGEETTMVEDSAGKSPFSYFNLEERTFAVVLSFMGLFISLFGVLIGSFGNTFLILITMGMAAYVMALAVKIYLSVLRAAPIIPPEDRELLVDIIKQNGKDGIDVYIKISSLYGFTGNITKIGLSGLPLLTAAITICFTLLAALLWTLQGQGKEAAIIGSLMDMAKLTLGAFIGSFVQRAVSEHRAPEGVFDKEKDKPKKDDKPKKEDEPKKEGAAT